MTIPLEGFASCPGVVAAELLDQLLLATAQEAQPALDARFAGEALTPLRRPLESNNEKVLVDERDARRSLSQFERPLPRGDASQLRMRELLTRVEQYN